MARSLIDMVSFVASQGEKIDYISEKNCYVAFLTKIDLVAKKDSAVSTNGGSYDILFELLSAERSLLLFDSWLPSGYCPNFEKALLFHLQTCDPDIIKKIFANIDAADLAEGSWWALKLDKQLGAESLSGDLYKPERGLIPGAGKDEPDFGLHGIKEAVCLALPKAETYSIGLKPPEKGPDPEDDTLKRVVDAFKYAGGKNEKLDVLKDAAPAFSPSDETDDTVAAAVSAVGIMDVGHGSCNLILDDGMEPLIYFDLGYPQFAYDDTAPRGLVPASEGKKPILERSGATELAVVLSHLDPDHWRLGAAWKELRALTWIIPNQPRGWVTQNFLNMIPNLRLFPDGVSHAVFRGVTLHRCSAENLPDAALLDSSGLAMRVGLTNTRFDEEPVFFLMTGDAAFTALKDQDDATERLVGINAVHHGSHNRGAAADLPKPYFAEGTEALTANLVFSYGVNGSDAHAYGLPSDDVLSLYQDGWWGPQGRVQSTAEGDQIGKGGATHRGNIRFGAEKEMPDTYKDTAFYAIEGRLFTF